MDGEGVSRSERDGEERIVVVLSGVYVWSDASGQVGLLGENGEKGGEKSEEKSEEKGGELEREGGKKTEILFLTLVSGQVGCWERKV